MIKTTLFLFLFCGLCCLSLQQNLMVTIPTIPIPPPLKFPPPFLPPFPPTPKNWQQQMNAQIEALQDQLDELQEQWDDIFENVFNEVGEVEQLVVPDDLNPDTIVITSPGAEELVLSLENEEWSYEYVGEGEDDFYDINFNDGNIILLPENGGNITIYENGGVSIVNVKDVTIASNINNVTSVISSSQTSTSTTTSSVSHTQSP